MAKKKPADLKTYRVPMSWTMNGSGYVQATSPEEAVEKAEKLTDTELHERGAELVDWEVTGSAEEWS